MGGIGIISNAIFFSLLGKCKVSLIKEKEMVKVADDFKIRVLGLRGPVGRGHKEKLEKFADELLE